MTAYLETSPNFFHLSLQGVADVVNPVPPRRGDMIGWPSRLVPGVEVSEVVNIPAKVFATVYRRLQGTMRNPLGRHLPAGRIGNFLLPAIPVQRETVLYTPTAADMSLAGGLAADIKTRPSVMNLHEWNATDISRTLDVMAKEAYKFASTGVGYPYQPVRLHLYHGAYGTGKTFQVIQDLAAQHAITPFTPATLAFHTWGHNLRESLKNDVLTAFPNLGLLSGNFMTECVPLAQPRTGTIVIDDAGQCWNSFIPLLIAANPGIRDIYLTFDACQAQGVFPEAPSISRKHPSTSQWLGAMSTRYATQVVRTSPDITELYGLPPAPAIPGRIVHRGEIIFVSQSPADVPLLAVSPRFTQTQSMGGQVADTFTEAQGHTIHGDVCIDLGGLTATATEHAAWTALTRATGNIYLKLGPMLPNPLFVEGVWCKSQILAALLTVASTRRVAHLTVAEDPDSLVKSAVLSHMSRCLSPAAAAALGLGAPDPVVGGRPYVSARVRESWLSSPLSSSDVYTARTHRAVLGKAVSAPSAAFSRHSALHSHGTTVAHAVRHLTALPGDALLSAVPTSYQLPPDPVLTATHDPAFDVEEPTDDVAREMFIPDGAASFQHIPDGAPAALHHTRADRVTDLAGQQKRIRVGPHSGTLSHSDRRRLASLKKGFAKFFDVDAWNSEAFNPALMEHCSRAKLASWASKRTKRALQQSVDKQDLDMPYNFVKLFPKGQYIKKKAKWRSDAFPSQTVSDFHLGRIFRDSPYALYLETQVLKFAYSSTYLHCRASPDDVSSWYRRHWRPGVMTGNDYTAWDSGVDHVFLEFDLWLMHLCHFPQSYIDALRYDRLNTHSHLGPHSPRQESGDRWTWILNSARNAALTGASLDCPKRTPVCVSGDDSVTLGAWRRSTGFVPSQWIMQPKREEGVKMEFCGLVFGGDDITFDASVVHWRAKFGLQQGRNDPDYWRSIRDAIRESASRLGNDSPRLASARHALHCAVHWFGLDRSLLLPSAPPPYQHASSLDLLSSFFSSISSIVSWFFFLDLL